MKKFCSLLVILVAFANRPIYAEVISYALVGPVSFSVADLDANDGVTPKIEFYGADSANSGQVYNLDNANNFYNLSSYQNFVPGMYGSYSGSTSNKLANSSSSITGTNFTNTSALAQGRAVGSTLLSGNYGAGSTGRSYFTLSENTAVTFFADAKSIVSSNATYDPALGLLEYSIANAYLGGQFTDANGLTRTASDILSSEGRNNLFNPVTSQYENVSQSQSRQISFTFNNFLSEIIYGNLIQSAGVEGYSYLDYAPSSAVPDPAAFPLMLSGLAVLGVVACRRK